MNPTWYRLERERAAEKGDFKEISGEEEEETEDTGPSTSKESAWQTKRGKWHKPKRQLQQQQQQGPRMADLDKAIPRTAEGSGNPDEQQQLPPPPPPSDVPAEEFRFKPMNARERRKELRRQERAAKGHSGESGKEEDMEVAATS